MALLRAARRIPLVKTRVIPWLVREEVRQIPAATTVQALREELSRIAQSRGPIIVGPWLSEVGFELLYWIPFLNWAAREFGLTKDRLIAVTRGGAASWYTDLCDRSVDLFDLLTPDAYRAGNADRWHEAGHQKQLEITDGDQAIVSQALDRLDCADAAVLHPSLMYNLYRYYWYEKGSISLIRDHSEFRRLPTLKPMPAGLPREYVAVRFYFRPSFPDTPENRAFVTTAIQTLAAHVPVVLLNTGLALDDHEDFWPDDLRNVHDVRAMMTPRENLDTQTRIIAGARAFVGTYGGLAYLGPLLGIPSVGVYSEMNHIIPAHLDISDRLCAAMKTPMVTLDVRASELLRWVFDRPCSEHSIAASASATVPSLSGRTEP